MYIHSDWCDQYAVLKPIHDYMILKCAGRFDLKEGLHAVGHYYSVYNNQKARVF